MRRLLQRAHNIEDLSFLENIDVKLTFTSSDRVKKKKGEEVK